VSCLNRRHMVFAWCSLFSVAFSDVYVRMCSMGVWTDWRNPLVTEYLTHEHDVLIIGAGGAGLRAAVGASAAGAKVAVISKSLLGKAHTVMAEAESQPRLRTSTTEITGASTSLNDAWRPIPEQLADGRVARQRGASMLSVSWKRGARSSIGPPMARSCSGTWWSSVSAAGACG